MGLETERIALLACFNETDGLVHGLVTIKRVTQDTVIQWFEELDIFTKEYYLVWTNWKVQWGKD